MIVLLGVSTWNNENKSIYIYKDKTNHRVYHVYHGWIIKIFRYVNHGATGEIVKLRKHPSDTVDKIKNIGGRTFQNKSYWTSIRYLPQPHDHTILNHAIRTHKQIILGTANFVIEHGDVPNLMQITAHARFSLWNGSAPKLYNIGGNAYFSEWNGIAPNLQFINGHKFKWGKFWSPELKGL